ncbi:MAG: CRISPR-associated endonuclease Cas2 [Defluviitaleaceae bacterium]|nr:CRISPR-associated endonuclease Cas2 [Defluviitaleaceae bacterium]
MLVLITYDVSTITATGRKRLQKIAKICQNYGQRVQNSVFECIVDNTQLLELKIKLKSVMNTSEDSLRIYQMGNNYKNKVEHFGIKEALDLEAPLIL